MPPHPLKKSTTSIGMLSLGLTGEGAMCVGIGVVAAIADAEACGSGNGVDRRCVAGRLVRTRTGKEPDAAPCCYHKSRRAPTILVGYVYIALQTYTNSLAVETYAGGQRRSDGVRTVQRPGCEAVEGSVGEVVLSDWGAAQARRRSDTSPDS